MIEELINQISPETITKYFRNKVSSFKPVSEDLNTYIVDENKYEILEVLNHISKNSNDDNYKLNLRE